MRGSFLILILFFHYILSAQQPVQPIGSWKEYLPYGSSVDLVQGEGKIYAATPYSLFSVDPADNSIERWSKVTGLSETGISTISYDESNKKLFIAYTNSNIDILYRNDILNIPDIQRDNIAGNKTIYGIYPLGKDYYLSTGLGIIVIDGERYEVKDTWFIGNGGGQVKVNAIASDRNFFYAATAQGFKRAAINGGNLADYTNWELLGVANGLSGGGVQDVFAIGDKVILQKDDSLFTLNGNSWGLLYQDGWPIAGAGISGNKIMICQRKPTGEARVTILNSDGTPDRIINTSLALPRRAILVQNEPWIADEANGLLHFGGSSVEQYQPNSPPSIASGELVSYNNILYAAAGGVDASWMPRNNRGGLYTLRQGTWTTIDQPIALDTVRDIISIAIDPSDESSWAGSFGGGLLHIKGDGSLEVFKQTVLSPVGGNTAAYRVAGLAFDREHSLWISNYGAALPLSARKADGSWFRYAVPYLLTENALGQIIVDDNDYKWILAPKGGGLICFDHNASLENTGDDHWKRLTSGAGSGNLPAGDVLCIAKDKNGFIWAGTTNGIGLFQCTRDIFTPNACEAIWPVVKQGNFAGYLFNGEEVRSIAVDGADRKWVATKNGAFLVSATGEEIVFRFTAGNSPLLSDDVRKIAIDGKTGEVFFATASGLCSFRGTATEGATENKEVLVFPNPVPPGYTGSIGIRGLVNNAIVKITGMDGRLVYQCRAAGGQAVWDGRDYKGRKISTGVYLVLVSNDERTEKAAAKIIFIGK